MNLLNLLAGVSGDLPEPEDITVTATKQAQSAPPALSAPSEAVTAKKPRIKLQDQSYDRPGMFGTRGTLRNILGVVGDAFLMQSGNKALYAPQRQRERVSDAMIGFTDDPLKALERMADVDPDAAAALYQMVGKQKHDEASLAATAGKNKSDLYDKGARIFGQYAGAANQSTYGRLSPILAKIKEQYQLGDEFEVPEAYDEALLSAYKTGGMPVNQQINTNVAQERLKIAREAEEGRNTRQSQREAGADRRDNPPPPAPRKGISNVDAEVAEAVLSGKATPSQKKYYDDRLRKGKARRGPPALPPGFSVKK